MKRAIRSLRRPKASGSYVGVRTSVRRTSRGWSSRVVRRGSRAIGHLRRGRGAIRLMTAAPPVVGQQVVQDVVDGDRAEQVVVLVHDRRRDHVVGGQVVG